VTISSAKSGSPWTTRQSISRKALDTIKESDDLVEIASAQFGLGLALMCCGDLDEAEAQMQAAVELTRQTGQNLLPVCYAYLGVVYRKRGDREAALEYARRVFETTTIHKDPLYFAIAISTLAWAAWRQRLMAGAEQQARQWRYGKTCLMLFPFAG
jgi:tetratricopeptide (TPR) repeat protein